MISGAHIVIYSKDPEADRVFFRDVLKFFTVDAGHGWLIFQLPPAEAAFHPSDHNDRHELYFMCDDLKSAMASFKEKNVECGPVKEERWGKSYHRKTPRRRESGTISAKASDCDLTYQLTHFLPHPHNR
jgi:hypothetical protein